MASYLSTPRTTEQILRRLKFCDRRWVQAMAHPSYRDEPTDERPFTEQERLRYWWADQWRLAYHEYEQALYSQKDVRLGMVEGLVGREPLTIYERDR